MQLGPRVLLAACAVLLFACRTPAPQVQIPLPDDVPTWPGARGVSFEEIPEMGTEAVYQCQGEVADVARFYAQALRERGWRIQENRVAEGQADLNAQKRERSLGIGVRSGRGGCEIQLLLLGGEPAPAGRAAP